QRTEPLPKLEKKFAAFVRARAENLAPGADLDKPPSEDAGAERLVWEKLHPHNYYLMMQKARDLMDSKHWAEAKPLLQSIAAAYDGERRAANPFWLAAVTERNLKDTNAELALLEKFAAQESDFADLDLRLIELTGARRDWPAETKYARQLLQINPLTSAPYRGLAEAGIGLDNKDQAIEASRKLLLLDPPDPAETHYTLARLLHARGGGEGEAKRQVLEALEDAPRYRDAQRLLLQIE
ncbi:MAG TPA: hypothetical protein VFC44_24000, partial [Candidatus Saccharimonadales bacterium]|nr:hypothetical protein [Candidatus Saccharimonadales bacterium]